MKKISIILSILGIMTLFLIYLVWPIKISGKVEKQTTSTISLSNNTLYCANCPDIKNKVIEARIIKDEYYNRFEILTIKSKDFNTP